MRVQQERANVYLVRATSQELATLFAAARMTLDAMRGDPEAPLEAVTRLDRLLADYDDGLRRLASDPPR